MADRILLVSHESTLSGSPIQLVDLAIGLQERGWKPSVVTPEPGPIVEKLRTARVDVMIEPQLLLDPGHAALRSFARSNDLIIANTIAAWQAIQAAHLENVPSIWYLHETLVGRRLIVQIPEIRASLRLARALVVPTASTAAVYETWAGRPINVIPYGISVPRVRSHREKSDQTVFVILGSFERRKGQDLLVEAIANLKPETRKRGRFQMAGRNLDELFYESFRRRAGRLAEVELLGPQGHDESLGILAESDVLICSSRDETMPIVILEAMSMGKTVISTDVGGIREWLRNGLNALVVPSEDPTALSRAIGRCIRDPELVERLGRAGIRTYQAHFTLQRYCTEFEELIRRVIAEGKENVIAETRSLDWPMLYEKWVSEFDTFTAADRIEVQRGLRNLRRHPLISVVLPVYNPNLKLLRQAIDSIKNQVYPHWQLCIADDASIDPQVRPFLETEQATDARIKVVFRERNGHIAACSNSALALATGAWCALLDQDDALLPHALAEVALEINANPNVGLIYSDEDKIDSTGTRSFPFFKSDWNPELFLAQNYVNHLGVYRTSLLREVGGFREGFEGSQDYDLALRCVERLEPDQIRHIPRVLYHWRTVPGSLADEADAKPYAREAARRAIQEHLERRGVSAQVEPCRENPESHRVIYKMPMPPPLVSIIIPTRDQVSFLRRCVESVRTITRYEPLEIIIVDNGSRDSETLDYLGELRKLGTRIIRDDEPFNFSRLINRGAREASGDLLLFLNNDVEVTEPEWMGEMVRYASRSNIGVVGARLWYPDGTLQHGGVVLGLGGVASHAHHRVPRGHPGYFNRAFLQQNCSAVTAACMLVRKTVFEAVAGFNELDVGTNFSDVDFCLRVQKQGWQIVWTPSANLVHHESISRGTTPTRPQQDLFMREAGYVQRRWGKELLADPFYNPNLCLELPAFYPAFPPRRLLNR